MNQAQPEYVVRKVVVEEVRPGVEMLSLSEQVGCTAQAALDGMWIVAGGGWGPDRRVSDVELIQ